MKKKYKFLLIVIGIEFAIVLALSELEFTIQTFLGNAIGVFVLLLPIEVLLYCLSKDTAISKGKRVLCTIAFWHICVSWLAGGIALLLLR